VSGVPAHLLTAHDFISVRPGLSRLLGGMDAAGVLTLIDFRSGPGSPLAVEHDGVRWWTANLKTISEDTGLTVDQVRGALKKLLDGGFIERAKHQQSGRYDQTYSYRTVVEAQTEVVESPHEEVVVSPHEEVVESPHPPIKNLSTREEEIKKDDRFDEFWSIYPEKRDKAMARTKWKAALKVASADEIIAGAQRYRDDPNRDPQFTKYPKTWLGNKGWEEGPLRPKFAQAKRPSQFEKTLTNFGLGITPTPIQTIHPAQRAIQR
jgi:DNA-binding MarR family transcriptional regulator